MSSMEITGWSNIVNVARMLHVPSELLNVWLSKISTFKFHSGEFIEDYSSSEDDPVNNKETEGLQTSRSLSNIVF